ncbi:MAG: tape measure protein [Paraprevotella sp.]|nr:tape measure protein [Paraprevotella sp.]
MSSIFDYIFNLKGNYSVKIDDLTDKTAEFQASVAKSQDALTGLGQACISFESVVNVVKNITDVFTGVTNIGANAELQLINMKTLFGGNAEAAQEMYDRISEYGKVTPYDKAGLIDAQKTMMSFGMSGEQAFTTLKQIGDIAMGDSQKMQSLSLAFAQMHSTGKLTGQDLMQMINAGFNPLNEISKATGKSVGQLKEEMSKGAISAEQVAWAFQAATSEGGLFHNAIDEASQTTAGRMASMRDAIDEMKVSLFNFMPEFFTFAGVAGEVLVPIAQMAPLVSILGGAFTFMKTPLLNAYTYLGMYNGYLSLGKVENLGFAKNVIQASVALVRFATVGVFQALKGLGALLLSFITTGATSTTFATIASGAFGAFKLAATTACRAVTAAIGSIPIVGWIAIAITALAAVGVYFWKTSAKFRATLKGLWAAFKAVFTGIFDMAKTVFGGLGDLIKAAFSLDGKGIKAALNKMKGGFSDFGSQVGKAFSTAYNEEMERSRKEEEDKKKAEADKDKPKGTPTVPGAAVLPPLPDSPVGTTLATTRRAASGTGTGRISNVTITIDRLVERFEIHTTNLQGDLSRVRDMVAEALISAVNDAQTAMT